jgi:glucose 1-dehydrogenase (EC 1.1.1.47)
MEDGMPQPQLKNSRAIVTGASSGIGEGIARAFAAVGASVIVNYRSGEDAARYIVGEIRENGGRAEAVQADVSTPEGCGKLFEAADEQFGGVDILVANAGIQRDAAFTELSLDDWRKVIDVNLTGQFICAGGGAALSPAGSRPESLAGTRKDHLHELGASGHSLGGPRKLRHRQRRRENADGDDGARAFLREDPRQRPRTRGDQDGHQP